MDELQKQILRGKVLDVPRYPVDVVKVYICTAVQDMMMERTYVMKNVLPKLRQYCKDKYATEFQLVDLKWGISEQEIESYSCLRHCLDAILECRQQSVGPNFVLMLGQKYGPVILQRHISVVEMDALCQQLEPSEASYLKSFYKLDENARPPGYVKEMSLIEGSGEDLAKTRHKLAAILKEAGRKAEKAQTLDYKTAVKFYASGVEQEILEGLLHHDNPGKECLVFTRHFPSIDLAHKSAYRYVDVVKGKPDTECQKQLIELLEKRVIPKVPSSNLFQYTDLKWGTATHGGVTELTHGDYLDDFATDFESAVQALIDEAMKARSSARILDPLYLECIAHAALVKEHCEQVFGQEKDLKVVRKYIDDAKGGSALVLSGPAGCGKTSLIAKAASLVNSGWNQRHTVQIVRFLGTTPATSHIVELLRNLIQHIYVLLESLSQDPFEKHVLHDDFESLSYTFNHVLGLVPRTQKLIIFLDGVDDLDNSRDALTKMWIPTRLPSNVKFVLSVQDDRNNSSSPLLTFGNVIELSNLKPVEVQELLKNFFEAESRALTAQQWNHLRRLFGDNNQSYLFVKLIWDVVKTWRSYDRDLPKLPTDVVSYVKKLFARLEADHGRILVTHVVLFVELTGHGVGALEIEDLLSLDEDVMEEVFDLFVPPLRRFPCLRWRAFLHDTRHLSTRFADNTAVLKWNHKVFRQIAQSRYKPVQTPTDEYKTHTSDTIIYILADYFTGKWADLPKSFQYTKKQLRRTGLLNPFAESLRCVPKHQTMNLSLGLDGGIQTQFNQRKMSVLLEAYSMLIRSNMEGAMELLSNFTEHVIFDFEMMYGMLKLGRVRELLHIQELCAIAIPSQCDQELLRRELFLFSEYFLQDMDYLRRNPDCFGPFLQAQSLFFYGLLPSLTRFVDTVDNLGRDICALVPTSQHTETIVSRAQCRVIDHVGPVYGCVCTEMCIYSLSTRLVAARYELSGYTTVYNKVLHPPPGDHFSQIVAAQGPWDATFEPASDNMEWVILYLVLSIRPHIYVYQGSTGQQLRVIRCNEVCRDIAYKDNTADSERFRIARVHAMGSQNSAWHLLCVSFQCGIVLVINSQNSSLVWKSTDDKSVIGHVDIGYCNGSQMYGYALDSGHITWLCWNNLQTDSSQLVQPVAQTCHFSCLDEDEALVQLDLIIENGEMRNDFILNQFDEPEADEEEEAEINSNRRVYPDSFSEDFHLVVATSQSRISVITDVMHIQYSQQSNSIKIEKALIASRTISLTLQHHDDIVCLAGKVALTNESPKGILVACSTTRNAFLIAFNRTKKSASITHAFDRTFDHVVLRSGFLIGAFGSFLELFNVAEHESFESLVVQRLVELDEQRGPIRSVHASATTGVMLVTCCEYNTLAVYLTHLLNVYTGGAYSVTPGQRYKRTAQARFQSITCASNLALTLSQDNHHVVIWDVQSDVIKREIYVKDAVEQFCLSITETHVAVATTAGKVLLYTVDYDEDLPATCIKQFHIQNLSTCWMTSLHSQPHVICVINKNGAVTIINVHTCVVNNIQETRLPQGIDCVLTRNHDIYVIAHKWRSFIGIQPGDNTITWELDMNCSSGKSLQKFGRRIVNLSEYNGDVYLILTGSPQYITSPNNNFTLLCIKPTANSIFKLLDLNLPKNAEIICASGQSNYILFRHDELVYVVDLNSGAIVLKESLLKVAITSDGQYIAGIQNDRVLRLIRMLDKQTIALITLRTDVVDLGISSDDEYVTVAGQDRHIYSFALADPYKQEHSITIKKLPSRNQAITSDIAYAKEDARFELLHQMTKLLDSSGYVSEAASSLDSAYGQASRIYSADGGTDSRTTRLRLRVEGNDLLTQVFGEDGQKLVLVESRTPSTLKGDNQQQPVTPPSPTITAGTSQQSLQSVEIPIAMGSSVATDSPTKTAHFSSIQNSGVVTEGGSEVQVQPLDLRIDLSEIENASLLTTTARNGTTEKQRAVGDIARRVLPEVGDIARTVLPEEGQTQPEVKQNGDVQNVQKENNEKPVPVHQIGDLVPSIKIPHNGKDNNHVEAPVVATATGAKSNRNHATVHQVKFEEMHPCKPFVLSYKSAVLQQSTQERLQRIKNQFVDVGFDGDDNLENSHANSERLTSKAPSSTNRSARHPHPNHTGEVVASYRRRSRSRSKSPRSTTRQPEGTKTSRACVIS